MLGVLRDLEWSIKSTIPANQVGNPRGEAFQIRMCPVCRGVNPADVPDGAIALPGKGHREGCLMAAELKGEEDASKRMLRLATLLVEEVREFSTPGEWIEDVAVSTIRGLVAQRDELRAAKNRLLDQWGLHLRDPGPLIDSLCRERDEARLRVAELLRELGRPADAPGGCERVLETRVGVFCGAEGLRGLAEADSFWEEQEYGTRLYYGDGGCGYLHRGVLQAAVRALDAVGKEDEAAAARAQEWHQTIISRGAELIRVRGELRDAEKERDRLEKVVARYTAPLTEEQAHRVFCNAPTFDIMQAFHVDSAIRQERGRQ